MHTKLHHMVSGQAGWVGREDIHVYCWAPCDLVPMPTGRMGWQRRPKRYKVFTFDTPGSPWDAGGWLTADEASRQIDAILAQEESHAA